MLALPSKNSYEGARRNAQPHGRGIYTFASGNHYEGEFEQGEFHGEGTLYVKGKGKVSGRWAAGRLVTGAFEFEDGLEHSSNGWTYCTEQDRRYWKEMKHDDSGRDMGNIRPHLKPIKAGCYDCIDGQFDPEKGAVVDYDSGEIVRNVSEAEQAHIKAHAFRQP